MIDNSSLSTTHACLVLEVGRRSYYVWKENIQLPDSDLKLRSVMHDIALEFPKYGYRRMTYELRRRNAHANHKKVLRIMQEEKLTCKKKRAYTPITTQSGHGFAVYPNLVKDLVVIEPNHVWVSDITYIRLLREFVYLAVIIDLFSRKCVGWALSRNVDAQLALDALNRAIETREHLGFSSLIHHSDRGVQYASALYVEQLMKQGIKISMSGKGNVYDNAFAESFMKTLKVEEVYMNEYETFNDVYQNIKQFIEGVYNEKRLHSSIGYMPPNEYEKEALNKSIKA